MRVCAVNLFTKFEPGVTSQCKCRTRMRALRTPLVLQVRDLPVSDNGSIWVFVLVLNSMALYSIRNMLHNLISE